MRAADAHEVAGLEHVLLGFLAVHKGARGAVEIDDRVFVAFGDHLAMHARDVRVREMRLRCATAAEQHYLGAESEYHSLIGAGEDDQFFCHEWVSQGDAGTHLYIWQIGSRDEMTIACGFARRVLRYYGIHALNRKRRIRFFPCHAPVIERER